MVPDRSEEVRLTCRVFQVGALLLHHNFFRGKTSRPLLEPARHPLLTGPSGDFRERASSCTCLGSIACVPIQTSMKGNQLGTGGKDTLPTQEQCIRGWTYFAPHPPGDFQERASAGARVATLSGKNTSLPIYLSLFPINNIGINQHFYQR
ncbi:hypothetical protein XELAEV_18009887mg [Xenopus laevis]|uniref:Uncharacterized protein n=1 Tax=Xenopus laevis TaxID=8355 RepID=A0A974DTP2_XENLA|nr:hypothetical protein XELAEV_18009887mg [Xenopus laevis]